MSFNRCANADYSGKGKNYDIRVWDGRPFTKDALKVIRNLGPISTVAIAHELNLDDRHAVEVVKVLEVDGKIRRQNGLWEVT